MPRPSTRVGRRFKVSFRPFGGLTYNVGYTPNVSRTGMFVATMQPPRPGDKVSVEITGNDGFLRLDAVVVHARRVPPVQQQTEPSGMGLRFLEPGESAEVLQQMMGLAASLW